MLFFLLQIKSKGFEAIYCIDPLDELCMLEIKKYKDFEIVDLSKSDVAGIDDAEETVSSALNNETLCIVPFRASVSCIRKELRALTTPRRR